MLGVLYRAYTQGGMLGVLYPCVYTQGGMLGVLYLRLWEKEAQ